MKNRKKPDDKRVENANEEMLQNLKDNNENIIENNEELKESNENTVENTEEIKEKFEKATKDNTNRIEKLRILSFIAIIAVVFIHSYNYKDTFLLANTAIFEGNNLGAMFEFLVSNALTRFAVPLFFAISGYLLFRNYTGTVKCYFGKIKSRFFSLVIPFFIWTVLAGGLIVILAVTNKFWNIPIIQEHTYFANKYGIIYWLKSSPAFQLWFVQELIKYTVFSFVIYFLIKKLKLVPMIVFGIMWVLGISFLINSEGLFFFSIGAYIAIHHKEDLLKNIPYKRTIIVSCIWIVLCIIYTIISANLDNLGLSPLILTILYRVNEILGLLAVWGLYDIAEDKLKKSKLIAIGAGNVFFVFVMHEPLLHFLYQYILTKTNSDLVHISIYILLPLILIAVCITFSILLKKALPKVHKVLTGAR